MNRQKVLEWMSYNAEPHGVNTFLVDNTSVYVCEIDSEIVVVCNGNKDNLRYPFNRSIVVLENIILPKKIKQGVLEWLNKFGKKKKANRWAVGGVNIEVWDRGIDVGITFFEFSNFDQAIEYITEIYERLDECSLFHRIFQ